MKKNEIKKILVPIDFSETSETAIDVAINLAKLFKAELLLFHVVEDYGYQYSVVPEMQFLLSPSIMELENEIKEKMDIRGKKIEEAFGINVKAFVNIGRVISEIIEFAKGAHINLIVMGTHGVGGLGEVFMGSNAQRIVTLSEVPVITIRTGAKKDFKKIVIPIDDSLHSREKVNIAIEIAKVTNAELHILGLINSTEKVEMDKFKIKIKSVEEIIESEKLPFTSTIEYGDNIAEMALNYSVKNNFDLIVINTGHESKTTGAFLGAFHQQIVNHSKIAVLSFRHREGHYEITTQGYGIE